MLNLNQAVSPTARSCASLFGVSNLVRNLRCGAVWLAAVTLVIAAGSAPARAQMFLGGDFQLNTYTTDFQRDVAVSMRPDRSFVAVWASNGSDGTDSDSQSVRGNVFDLVGNPLTTEFQVNTYTTGAQFEPHVATDAAGNFAVVWNTTGENNAKGQLFDSSGSPFGGEFSVNEATGVGGLPSVAMRSDGTFVAAYLGATSVAARLFDADASPLSGEIATETYITSESRNRPRVATNENGEFVVVWTSRGSPGTDNITGDFSIQGRLFDSSGTAVGAQFQVNTYTTLYQTGASVGMDATGAFVVAWSSQAGDGDGGAVRARRFASSGSPIGQDFNLNSYTSGNQNRPWIDMDPDGRFSVAWHSSMSAGTDSSSDSVQMRQFAADATPEGAEFQVNTYTPNSQQVPQVSRINENEMVAAWTSQFGSPGNDSFLATVAQIFGEAPPTTTTTSTTTTTLPVLCGATPDVGCAVSGEEKSSLQIKVNLDYPEKDKLKWKWGKGDMVPGADFEDPTIAGKDVSLCVYDSSGSGQPLVEAALRVGADCDGKPCWKGDATKGYSYKDKSGTPDGVAKAKLKPGEEAKAQIQVQAKGLNLSSPALGLTLPVTAQLVVDGVGRSCWQTVYSTASKNDASQFKAKGPTTP